jgi:hypothetical protein
MLKTYSLLAVIVFTSLVCPAQSNVPALSPKGQFSHPQDVVHILYKESHYSFGHSFKPWDERKTSLEGKAWIGLNSFNQVSEIPNRKPSIVRTVLLDSILLVSKTKENKILDVSKSDYYNKVLESARYNPSYILGYFKRNAATSYKSFPLSVAYDLTIGERNVRLSISHKDSSIEYVSSFYYHNLYGDVYDTIFYKNYRDISGFQFPTFIEEVKLNGKLRDTINVELYSINDNEVHLLEKPVGYILSDKKESVVIKHVKENDHIHYLELEHTDDRVLIVEFDSFLVVAESPLSSENGELILDAISKFAPNKEIRYFLFGHWHPHYTGGMRPFVHKGATVVVSDHNRAYINELYESSHSLNPDSLEMDKKELKTHVIDSVLTIKDSNYEMQVYFIGEISRHTIDYLIYYFPEEKIVFEDDLVWMKKEGEMKSPSEREKGLHRAITERKLKVETIVQSWPVTYLKVHTIIPYDKFIKKIEFKPKEK